MRFLPYRLEQGIYFRQAGRRDWERTIHALPCEGGREAALEALGWGIWRLGRDLRNQLISGAEGVGKATRALTPVQVRTIRWK